MIKKIYLTLSLFILCFFCFTKPILAKTTTERKFKGCEIKKETKNYNHNTKIVVNTYQWCKFDIIKTYSNGVVKTTEKIKKIKIGTQITKFDWKFSYFEKPFTFIIDPTGWTITINF